MCVSFTAVYVCARGHTQTHKHTRPTTQDIDTAIHALESHTQAIGPTPSSAQSPDDELTAPEERGKGIAERVRKEWRVILGALAFRKRDATTYGVC